MAEYKRKIKATGGVIISKLNFRQQESASGGWQQSSWLLNLFQLFRILPNPYWRQVLWQLLIFQGHNMLKAMSIRKSSWHQAGLRAVQLFDLPKTWLDPKSQKLARIETWLWHFFANARWVDQLTTLERCGMPWPEIAVLWSFAASKIGSFSEMVVNV